MKAPGNRPCDIEEQFKSEGFCDRSKERRAECTLKKSWRLLERNERLGREHRVMLQRDEALVWENAVLWKYKGNKSGAALAMEESKKFPREATDLKGFVVS